MWYIFYSNHKVLCLAPVCYQSVAKALQVALSQIGSILWDAVSYKNIN